jgi:hypothetical protein
MIYVFADCSVALPNCFSRELLWKHLDGILEARCWRGLGSNYASGQNGRTARVDHGSSYICDRNDDPEGIIKLLTSVRGNWSLTAELDSVPVHKFHIAITDNHWVATGEMGTIWYEARDLDDEDVPHFAVIDALTRVLPYCRGGILEIRTNNVRLLWGACGTPSGAWFVVRSTCHSRNVHLRAKWDELKGLSTRLYAHPARGVAPAPGRDAGVVSTVVEELRVLKGRAVYCGMADHLLK